MNIFSIIIFFPLFFIFIFFAILKTVNKYKKGTSKPAFETQHSKLTIMRLANFFLSFIIEGKFNGKNCSSLSGGWILLLALISFNPVL